MGKRRNLNGLANTLEQRYFSTLFWYEKAYMADWIWHAAHEKSVSDVVIDILQNTVDPKVLAIRPIIVHLPLLRETITRTLETNGFPPDFITDARLIIHISESHRTARQLTCKTNLTDQEGHLYEGRTYTEQAYEDRFRVFGGFWGGY